MIDDTRAPADAGGSDEQAGGHDPLHASHLSLDALCGVGFVSAAWLSERVEAGLIPAHPGADGAWRFEATVLRRVSTMHALERDFDANPELAALVADLRDEIEQLRHRLARMTLRAQGRSIE